MTQHETAYFGQFSGDEIDDLYMDEYPPVSFDHYMEETNKLHDRVFDLEQALKKLTQRTVAYSDVGSSCLHCTAQSDRFVDFLIHDPECPINIAIRVLAEQPGLGVTTLKDTSNE